MLEPGNIDLYNRPIVHNLDGSISTVRSMTFEDNDGSFVLLPSVSKEGKEMNGEETYKYYKQTGQHLGKFASEEEADSYAQSLHEQQDRYYSKVEEQANNNAQLIKQGQMPEYNAILNYSPPSILDTPLLHNGQKYSDASYQNRDLFRLMKGLNDTRLDMDRQMMEEDNNK